MPNVKIFSGSATLELAKKIAQSYGTTLGSFSSEKFSDGELWVNFNESIRGCDIFLIQSTFAPSDNLMELLLMVDAAKRASAHSVSVVIPYFGYARQDRKDRPRVAIAAKLVANLLTAAGADRLITIDLHAGQIQGFFDFPVDHLYGSAVFVPYIKQLNLKNRLVFAAPDVGGLSRARAYSKYFQADLVVCDKHRDRPNEISYMHVIGKVENADVIIIDDMVDTGGTICTAAELMKEKGAKTVRAMCTHPVLSGNAYQTIEKSLLEELVVTDTIPVLKHSSKINSVSVSDLFAKAILHINDHGSISSLFIQ